jgi:hypothetical protein
MARNENRPFRSSPADHAPARVRSAAASWQAFANLMVASTLVVAVVVGALALVEAVLSPPASKLARQFPKPGLQHQHAGAPQDAPNAAARPGAVLFVTD